MAKLIWITGLAGSGKSTIGKKVYERIKPNVPNTVFLDGDLFRSVLGDDLGHDPEGRIKNAKRIANMCKLLVDQDINVICATMSLYREVHDFNRINISEYCEIFVTCTQEELIRRDQKGLYSKAIRGEINNVVGVDLPYDCPEKADLILDNTSFQNLEANVEKIMKLIED